MANDNPYLELVSDNATQGGVGDNPYTPIIQSDTAQRARSSVANVADVNPDVDARVQKLARQYGVPVDAARLDPKPLERKAQLDSIDYAALARKAPGTANFISDPKNAAVSHDDVGNMSLIESVLKDFDDFRLTVRNAASRGWQAQKRKWDTNSFRFDAGTVQDIDRIEQMLADGVDPNSNAFNLENDPLGLAQMTKEDRAKLRDQSLEAAKNQAQEIAIKTNNMAAIPNSEATVRIMNADRPIDQAASFDVGGPVYGDKLKGWESFKATAAEFAKSPATFIADVGVESLVGNLDALVAALPATILGGPVLGAAVQGLGSYNTDYAASFLESLSEQGVDIRDSAKLTEAIKDPAILAEARRAAHTHALVVSMFDAGSAGVASKMALPKSLQATLKDKPFLKELVNILAVQPVAQGTMGAAGEFIASEAAGKDVSMGELFGEFFGEALGAPVEALVASSKRLYGEFVKVDAAESAADNLKKLDELAKASKVRSRDVDTFEAFVASATENNPVQEVFIDAQTLAQSGLADQVMAVSPSVAEQFQTALDAGTQVSIPVAEYTARIAGTELSQSLLEHLRTEPDGFSQAEAKQYMQSYAEELKADVERTLQEKRGDEAFKAQIEAVKVNIKTQLDTASRFTSQVNDAYASMVANFYGVMAGKLGIKPDELLAQFPLRIQSQNVMGGQQFDQGLRLADIQQQWDDAGIESALSERDGTITLSQIVVPEAERGKGKGTEAIESLIKYADSTGQRIVLTPSTEFGATSKSRLGKFYKRFGFVENKGRNKDFSTRESMIRLPKQLNQSGVSKYSVAAERKAKNFTEARSAASDFQGKDLTNKESGLTARVSRNSLDKMLSSKAVGKSETAELHSLAVANLDRLFENAILGWTKPDSMGDSNLSAIHRFFSVLETDSGPRLVKLTVKESARSSQANRIYTVETISVNEKSPAAQWVDSTVRSDGIDPTSIRSTEDIISLAKAVQEINNQLNPKNGNVLNQSAWHGSPFHFDKFSLEHMGNGEGAQAFGWGLYFASNRAIAEWYRDNLSSRKGANPTNEKFSGKTPMEWYAYWEEKAIRAKDPSEFYARMGMLEELELTWNAHGALNTAIEEDQPAAAVKWFKETIVDKFERPGKTYQVEIPESDNMLDWDKPLSEQPKNIQAAIEQIRASAAKSFPNIKDSDITGGALYNAYAEHRGRNPQAASEALNELGVKGIKYLDNQSRDGVSGVSHNFVVFDDSAIQIVEKYQQGENTNRGSFNPATNTITLLKNADLSTFLHESGHFFLETQFNIAARIAQEAAAFGSEGNTAGQQQILEDTNALLKWFGISDLDEWNGLDFEEKRSYHEKFARGFEAYLFEGKAPSIEVEGIFQRFRAWMLNVYKELKNLNVELTDEVRSVFDRMIATNEQIALAEQARSMMELFTSPDQAGMTVEEFAAYQALGVNATADAIQDLQARGLRDLAWSRNARGREIKKLQKQAAARRAEVSIDVRREVMSQPIYRAWQFLTAKLTADDKITPETLPKSDPNILDETVDSLFTAIAKLGGLDRAEVEKQWGFDTKERSPMPAFGKYTLRRDGGLSIDAMGEALAERGYLSLDENGRFDQRELEDRFDAELRGDIQYSNAVDERILRGIGKAGESVNVEALGAGRFDATELSTMGLPAEIVDIIKNLKMTAKNGLHPDIVAEMFGFTSGDELVRTLAIAQDPKQEIADLTDTRMLELYGELATPEAIEREADKAIHNENRARVVATEANALAKATGQRKVLIPAAKEFARAMIAKLKIRDIRPGQYAAAEVRAAKASEKASKAGDLATAAAEKRNQLVNTFATRAAYDAQDEVESTLRYLKKFDNEGTRKNLDVDYLDQIDALLERFDLRKGQSLKAIDKRTSLAAWLKSQLDQGLEPSIPEDLQNEAFRKSYKDMTVEEIRGLADSIKQIEHLGRLKNRLLTAANNRAFAAVRDEMAKSIIDNANGREADTRTPTTNLGRALSTLKNFFASHVKAATWARIMDGGHDGGAVWEYLVRPANVRGDMETSMRADATRRLSEILAPVFKLGKMGGKGVFFPTINRSLNREARLSIALNVGNEGNLQRLLGGEGWTAQQIAPILATLTATEWKAVQEIWDHFETYRPEIAAKERRVYGKEPDWVEPTPFQIKTADGSTVDMRGGYYPIKYDPAASQRAEEYADAEGAKRQLQGAFTSATTRRSFTKARSEEIVGRPLIYTLAGLYSGVNDVIHDLAWHEWLIDANRLLRSKTIDSAMRDTYGPEAKSQFKNWANDIAEGDKGAANAGELAVARLRQGVSAAGLGFNVMSAAMQVLGFTQSIVRVGPQWVGRGTMQFMANPLAAVREVNGKSDFMANRSLTRFRELNELRNKVQDESATGAAIKTGAFYLMMRAQQMVDVPTWLGAYEKAVHAGNNEERSISLADQAVIDAQGGGQLKDLSTIERGGPVLKIFTVFYSFMNTALNLGVAQTMTANTPAKKAKLAVDYLLLYTVPPVLGYFLKKALTPGGDDEDWDKLAKKLAAEQMSYLMGLMVVVREFGEVSKIVAGAEGVRDYSGPAGVRTIADSIKFATQAKQGDFDDAFRKSAINLIGDVTGLPAAQINRTISGVQALNEGRTQNPTSVVFGFERK